MTESEYRIERLGPYYESRRRERHIAKVAFAGMSALYLLGASTKEMAHVVVNATFDPSTKRLPAFDSLVSSKFELFGVGGDENTRRAVLETLTTIVAVEAINLRKQSAEIVSGLLQLPARKNSATVERRIR